MKIYMAPMESLTGYIFRNAFNKIYGGVDCYFSPFIASKKLSNREKNDVLPEHNQGMHLIPQILTNKTGEFLMIAKRLSELGYDEVNFNLGCPSGTVVTKHRGAGFLAVPDELEAFLTEIFDKCPLKISIKTRIGMENIDEWPGIIKLYNQFPLSELIVHPRLRSDFYNGSPHYDAFKEAVESCRHPLCYNGDIYTIEDYHGISALFPSCQAVMLGRGLISNPGLALEIKGIPQSDPMLFKRFHDEIYHGYLEIMSGDRNTLFKMKELWVYLGKNFEDQPKLLKKIRKSNSCAEYEAVIAEIFNI